MGEWFNGITPGDLLRRLRARRDNASREDLEDAIQDVMLHALETARRKKPPPAPLNPEAYLVRSVHNRLNSLGRKHWREVASDSDAIAAAERPDNSATQPDEHHEARERALLFGLLVSLLNGQDAGEVDAPLAAAFSGLQNALAGELTDKHWLLIRLRVLEGMGFADCAQLLGVSLGTAHGWTKKTLAIVRDALVECGVDAGELAYEDTET